MKKAPRIKKALGGGVYQEPVKKTPEQLAAEIEAKRVASKTKVNVPNPNFKSADQQMYEKGMISQTELKRRQSDAFQMKGSGNFVTGKPTYGLLDTRVGKAKGGEVKKMTKAPRKGGKAC